MNTTTRHHSTGDDDIENITPVRNESTQSTGRSNRRIGRFVLEALGALLTGVVSLAVATVALRISLADISQRWTVGGPDSILHYFIFTSSTQTFAYANNPNVGFPDGVNFFFSTQVDVASALTMSALAIFIHNGIVLLNVYFLLTFAFAGVSAYLFFRALRIRPWVSLLFGAAFALAPYHFIRIDYGHAFIANCWAVPLIGIVALMVSGQDADPFRSWSGRATSRRARIIRLLIPSVVLGFFIAITTPYYFIFGIVVVGGVWFYRVLAGLLRRDALVTLFRPTLSFVILGMFVGVSLFLFSRSYGERYATYFTREINESEQYAGKFASLILPWSGSGFPGGGALSLFYQNNSKLLPTTEAPGSAILSSLGIIALLAVLLVIGVTDSRRLSATWLGRIVADDRTRAIAVATLWAFLFFIVSGLGIFVALFVGTQIRAWTRMSIVLILFGLGFFAILLNAATTRYGLRYFFGAAITAVVLLDQVVGVSQAVPNQPTTDAQIKEFVASTDAALPDGCGVIQLPIKSFPESGPIGAMSDYDEGLPFLYTPAGHIRWSYGSINGTLGWDALAGASSSSEAFKTAVEETGACAIYVNLDAYTDNVDAWKPLVDAATGQSDPTPVVTSGSGNLLIFEVPGKAGY